MNRRSIIVAGLCAAVPTLACAPIPGEGRFARVVTEEAVIIWDEAAGREHFIRRASFDTNAGDFGFLVPTPAKPELAEADPSLFTFMAAITAPAARQSEVVRAEEAAPRPSAVTVLEEKVLAGLNAAVLQASDPKALQDWLSRNGYPSTPDLVEWIAPYVAAKWKITAFKVAGGSPNVSSAAVRMSFQTEKPFFPYREPASQRLAGQQGARLLRVYFIADARFSGALGAKDAWPGAAVWSNLIAKQDLAALLHHARLPMLAGGGGRWVTEFEDRSSPRKGTDEVFFSRAADQSTLERPQPYVFVVTSSNSYQWIAAALAALIVIGIIVYRRRRRPRRLFG